jgi:hypothetical protein
MRDYKKCCTITRILEINRKTKHEKKGELRNRNKNKNEL